MGYASDLSDSEWALLEPLVPAPKPGGRPCTHSRRAMMAGSSALRRTFGRSRLPAPRRRQPASAA